MRPRPQAVVSIAAVALLAGVPVGHVWLGGISQAEREAARIVEDGRRATVALAARVAARVGVQLEDLAAREGERPWFHWQHFIADPGGVYEGEALVPSPLAQGPSDPLVAGYVQVGADGRVTTPEVFEGAWGNEVTEAGRARHERVVEATRSLIEAERWGEPEGGVEVAGVEPGQRPMGGPSGAGETPEVAPAAAPAVEVEEPGELQVQELVQVQAPVQQASNNSKIENIDPRRKPSAQVAKKVVVQELDSAFYQRNVNVEEVLEQIKGNKARHVPAVGAVAVEVTPFEWRATALGGEPALVAMRQVETPDGRRRQGFFVVEGAFSAGLVESGARLVAGDGGASVWGAEDGEPKRVLEPVLVAGVPSGWMVRVEKDEAGLEREGAALVSEARVEALVVTLIALLVAGLVIGVIIQSERLLERRQRFAAAAAHELRTPLAGLRMYAEMLAHGLGKPEKQRDYAERLVSEVARLGRVVSNVLDFSRLEKGGLALTPRDGDLAGLVREVAARLEPTVAKAGARLVVEVEGPLAARFDPDAVTQIVTNLVDNAEKYTRDSADRTITLSARGVAGGAELRVRDRGPGLPVGRVGRGRLFSPFRRGVGADGPAGLGLGLSLSRALARAQGGELSATRPADGVGAELVLRLPGAPA